MTHNTGRCFSKIFRVGSSQTSLQAPNPKYFVAHPLGMCGASSKSLPRKFEKVANSPHAGIFVGSARLRPQFFHFESDGRSQLLHNATTHPEEEGGLMVVSLTSW